MKEPANIKITAIRVPTRTFSVAERRLKDFIFIIMIEKPAFIVKKQ